MADLKVSFPQPCNEKWEAMAEQGCNRHCATCDTTIYDLSAMTVNEAEVLLESGDDICVRAKVERDGSVQTAASSKPNARRMVTAIGASMSLAVAACQPATLSGITPRYEIKGRLSPVKWSSRAKLTSNSGKNYYSRVWGNKKFRFTNLPAGTYSLSFFDDCGDPHEYKNIVVNDDMDMGELKWVDEDACIIIGKMKRDDGVRHA